MTTPTKGLLAFAPALCTTLLLLSCGGSSRPPDPDGALADAASPDAPVVDAGSADANQPSCAELSTPAATMTTYPSTFAGDLAVAEANLDLPEDAVCTRDDSSQLGLVAPGPDQVVALTGLEPGTLYYVKLLGEGDLAAYVITGCNEAAPGPGLDQCLAFVDGFGGLELTTFTAPADGKAFVVVDYYSIREPLAETSYSLTVTTDGCESDEDCGTTPRPFCVNELGTCGSASYCVGDDAAEAQTDDIPAGATPIVLAGGTVTINAHICQDFTEQLDELDYYQLTVADGAALSVSLAWADTAADLELRILDGNENPVGFSIFHNPEVVALTYLPAGTYLIQVERFKPDDSSVVTPYALTVTPQATALCTSTADCASTFQNQIFRSTCNAQGACQAFDGQGAVGVGGLCDSDDDCVVEAARCGGFRFTAHADTRSICTITCTTDTECQAVSPGARCTTAGNPNYCLKPCTADNECPILVGPPTPPKPWNYATCVVAQGRCKLSP